MLSQKLHIENPGSPPSYFGTDTYPLNWKSCPDDVVPDVSGLPSIDHAMFLFNAVKFHLGQHYRFFDDSTFLQNVQELYYGSAVEKAAACRLWFAQFLLVLAFGQAFVAKSKGLREPPGAKFFVRAMALIPDLSSLWKDSLLAIEVLALAGLYLYSTDHRESAHVYVCFLPSCSLNIPNICFFSTEGGPSNTHRAVRRTTYAASGTGVGPSNGQPVSRPLVDVIHHGPPFLVFTRTSHVYSRQ